MVESVGIIFEAGVFGNGITGMGRILRTATSLVYC